MSVIGNTALRLEDEQGMLLEVARDFCAAQGIEAVREQLEQPLAHTEAQWQSMVEMGWTGIGIDEAHGGAGLSIAAAVPVFESMGRALMGTPLMSSLLAAQLLRRAAGEGAADTLSAIAGGAVATVAELENEDWQGVGALALDADGRLKGRKRMVMDAQAATFFVVTVSAAQGDAPRLAVVDAAELGDGSVVPRVLMDNTRRAADVSFDGVTPLAVYDGEAVTSALRDYHLLGALLVAAESAGAAASCLDTVVDYLKTRKQFGKLIGSYQALKHPSVEILTSMDSTRSFVYHAATLVGGEGADPGSGLSRDAEIACRMAKAQATETLAYAGDRAVQFHGGMGLTWDCDAQLFIRRAQWAQQQFGDAVFHRRRLAELLLGP
jgi:alkylation response protein AidB-like acyl-CoA dehydrogenase